MQAIIKEAILVTINDYGLDRLVAHLSFAGTNDYFNNFLRGMM